MLDYKILSRSIDNRVFEDSDVVLFAATVAEACKDGWDPRGGVALTTTPTHTVIAQGMVRALPPAVPVPPPPPIKAPVPIAVRPLITITAPQPKPPQKPKPPFVRPVPIVRMHDHPELAKTDKPAPLSFAEWEAKKRDRRLPAGVDPSRLRVRPKTADEKAAEEDAALEREERERRALANDHTEGLRNDHEKEQNQTSG